ncbi:MAG: hypothetical protein WKF47_12690 [Geodermatophilaceae bacterium]
MGERPGDEYFVAEGIGVPCWSAISLVASALHEPGRGRLSSPRRISGWCWWTAVATGTAGRWRP